MVTRPHGGQWWVLLPHNVFLCMLFFQDPSQSRFILYTKSTVGLSAWEWWSQHVACVMPGRCHALAWRLLELDPVKQWAVEGKYEGDGDTVTNNNTVTSLCETVEGHTRSRRPDSESGAASWSCSSNPFLPPAPPAPSSSSPSSLTWIALPCWTGCRHGDGVNTWQQERVKFRASDTAVETRRRGKTDTEGQGRHWDTGKMSIIILISHHYCVDVYLLICEKHI